MTNPWSATQMTGGVSTPPTVSGYRLRGMGMQPMPLPLATNMGWQGQIPPPSPPAGVIPSGVLPGVVSPYPVVPAPTNIYPLAPGSGTVTASAICLNQQQNSVACADPTCTFGDCNSTSPQITTGPLCLDQSENQIACNAPNCTYGDCTGGASSSFWSQSTIISGIPDVAIYGVLGVLAAGLLFGSGRR
jgi:hypothetical protein